MVVVVVAGVVVGTAEEVVAAVAVTSHSPFVHPIHGRNRNKQTPVPKENSSLGKRAFFVSSPLRFSP